MADALGADDQRTALGELLVAHRSRLEARASRLSGNLHRITHLFSEGMTTMTDPVPASTSLSEEDERELAKSLFNRTWTLLDTEDRTRDDNDEMVHMAHASCYHWWRVGRPENRVRGEWQCSRVYAVLRRPEPAIHHAERARELCEENGIGDFDIAAVYEALARAHAVAAHPAEARRMTDRALEACENISDPEDRLIIESDLETIPGQARFW